MNIEIVTTIARPIEDVWSVVADDFTSIQTWSASVVTSSPLEGLSTIGGAPMAGRVCTFTDDPEGFGAREQITRYDAANHTLEFDVEPLNAPRALPIRRNHVVVTLRRIDAGTTELTWVSQPTLKPHGFLLYPMLKLGLAKSFRGIVGELKAFLEDPEHAARPQLGVAV